ncbi:MAG TPA: sigma-70 family RNA polymerase sigma factor [Polyangia bacterium]|jgi:RNA polymerase sigma-70 factor (ECF subfamily)|nr:sigma-70 family RNA polymerase sigma factor [Polyangia bacterium]
MLPPVHPDDGPPRSMTSSGAIAISADEPTPMLVLSEPRSPTVRDEEEQALIERCLAGDMEAFRPLVQRYQRLAFSVALRMLGSRTDAEDVAQQAFVDAFNALDRFRGQGRRHAFSTWLLRIAVNRSKDILKSKRRTEEPLRHDIPGSAAVFSHDPSNPESNASRGERRQHLEWALLRLEPKYREVLILKDIEDLSYDEIRSILELPISTLKIRAVRARMMLRRLVDGQGGR